jgi:hypothetical protein
MTEPEKTTTRPDTTGDVGTPFPADADVAGNGGDLDRYLREAADDVSEDDETEALDVEDEMPATLTRRQRADVVTARQTIHRAVAGHDDVDLPRAAALLDRVLRDGCPHDPAGWVMDRDEGDWPITMCWECHVGWYAGPD